MIIFLICLVIVLSVLLTLAVVFFVAPTILIFLVDFAIVVIQMRQLRKGPFL